MFSTLFTVALFFNIAFQAVFADFAVSTPEIFACSGKDVKVTWQASKAPYNIVVVRADDPCGDALIDAGDFQETFANIKTDELKAGQKVQISIEDADNEEGWSGDIVVKECPTSSASPVSASAGTTLVVGGYSAAVPSASASIAPVGGAANAASFGNNNAAAPRHISIPAVALTAIAGAVALLL